MSAALFAAGTSITAVGADVIGWLRRTSSETTTKLQDAGNEHGNEAIVSEAADLPTDVISLLAEHLPVIDAVGMGATCIAWRDAIKLGALSAFRTASGSSPPLAQTPLLDKVGITKESWGALLLMSRLVHAGATSITSCDPTPHEPAALNHSEPGSMAAHIRNVMRQVRHPGTVSQVVDKLARKFYLQMLNDDPDSFARRFALEVGEPRSRCTQPLSRRTMLEYWIELFVRFLKGNVNSTAELRDWTRNFLGYFLVRQWDEEELYRMISKMETSKTSALGAGETSNKEGDEGDEGDEGHEGDEGEEDYDGEYLQPSPRAVGEAMHDSARAVLIVLSAITASLNIFMEPEAILRDEALRDALALARISMAERGCTFELVQSLPEPDIKAREIVRHLATAGYTYPNDAWSSHEDEVEERQNGRWRICTVDRSRNCAFVCQYDDETRTAQVSFLPETMSALRAGPILTANLERRKNTDTFRVGMDPGYAWPSWYND